MKHQFHKNSGLVPLDAARARSGASRLMGFTPTPILASFRFGKIFARNTNVSRSEVASVNRHGETKKQRQNWCRGFTLVEMIIYIAFLATLTTFAMQATVIALKGLYSMRMNQSVNESATTALERMTREIRNATSIDTLNSTFNTHPGRLMLNTKMASGTATTMEFYFSGGQVGLKEGGVDAGSLMTKYATTTNLIFRQSTTTESEAVKIEISIQDTRDKTGQTAKFYDTIILRGSAH